MDKKGKDYFSIPFFFRVTKIPETTPATMVSIVVTRMHKAHERKSKKTKKNIKKKRAGKKKSRKKKTTS